MLSWNIWTLALQLENRGVGGAESCSKVKKNRTSFFPLCAVLEIRIRLFSGLPDPDQDPLVRGTDPADPDPLGRDTDPRIRIRTKVTRIPNTAYVKLIFFVHIVALCGQEAAKIIMKHENRLLAS